MYKQELREEREKVTNLSLWKSQLSEKNKELREENDRYDTAGSNSINRTLFHSDYLTKLRTLKGS